MSMKNGMSLISWLSCIPMSIFAYLSFCCLIEVKKKWYCKAAMALLCISLAGTVIFIGDPYNLPPMLLFFLACVWICCEGSQLKKLTIGMMFASTIFAFNGLFDNCLQAFLTGWEQEKVFPAVWGTNQRMLRDMIRLERSLGRTFFLLILYLSVLHFRKERDKELSPYLWKLLFMLCLPPFGIVFSLVLFRSPYASLEGTGTIFADTALFAFSAFAFFGLLQAVSVLHRQMRLEEESRVMEQNRKYYEAMEQQQFEIRRLKHDLNNHLQTLLALPDGEREDYLKELIRGADLKRVLRFSGDGTVNAVLTAKEGMLRQKGIAFHVKTDIPKELPFPKADICALFANALDNAGEGCEKLPPEKRRVSLEARADKGLLTVCVQNPYEENSCRESSCKEKEKARGRRGAFPKTTKADKKNHGYGLRSIRETVRKHGGSMEIRQENGLFTLFLYLPF